MSLDKHPLTSSFASHLLQNTAIKTTPSGTLYVDGEKLTNSNIATWMSSYMEFFQAISEHKSISAFHESLKVYIKEEQKHNRRNAYGDTTLVQGFSYDGLIPFISLTNHKKILFFDKTTSSITNLDYETYSKIMDKDRRILPLAAAVEFNPYRPEQIYIDTKYNKQFTHINLYKRPEWQETRSLSEVEKNKWIALPEIVDKFFMHLFPSEHCRNFVFDWLHFSLTSRCETYLVMNGAKGIGKNVLSNTICQALLGKNNHKVAHYNAIDNNFNSILADSRMIVFDEFKLIEDEDINKLKRYANAEQMIERKGKDVGETEMTYNSYIICNNSVTDIRIAWDDRRFSVVDMTTSKLEDVWTKLEVNDLLDAFSDPTSDTVKQFGYWLLYRNPSGDEFTCYKGEHFYKLCYASMPEWAKLVIDEVTSGKAGYYEEADLRLMFKERTGGMHKFPNKAKVKDFLDNYKHNGQHYLGEISSDERTYYIQVNKIFLKEATLSGEEDLLI